MSKRKRGSDAEEEDTLPAATDFRRQRQIAATFEDSAKQLARAFKAGKGFERQKLGRRKKHAAAAKDDKDVERIDAEVAALKILDNTLAAEHHLAKSLLKIKAIATSPNLPPDLQRPKPLPTDAPSLNVNARLCNSNPVKEAFPTAVAAVKREFGIKDDPKAPNKKRRLRAKDYDTAGRARSMSVSSADDEGDNGAPLRKRRAAEVSDDDSEPQDGSEGSEDDLQQYRGRLASSSDEEGDDDGLDGVSDIEELERRLMAEGISRKAGKRKTDKYDHAADLSLSEPSDDESVEEQPRKAAAPKKSSFIPSLTMGGYISGSGSDLDSDVDIAPKKNRRGQRARQKIWEQKYGSRATHLQNEQRNQGWDPKRGAVDSDRGGRFGKNKGNGANSMALGKDRRNPGQTKPAAEVKTKPRKDDSGPLHPSWEAAKRAKEKKSAPVAFQGKKISFD
ncbi:hypothetical protein CLAFUW4_00706 [Fulvia fulva]|uniref:Bud22 domain-containing protein n=1 Tax=Passalora fulva TaxID=5499 RepID=A0A9Q8P323_PASFU|nr:uncharacterized protein CLAFUR5_00709 [Fulvia fulva]KAK4635775.1 hypothetical protein CLAFUR4_00707 [Fulvia fulva]KAK4637314.1 hypothetical protein CLAFUR0_00708 [Fulvia fulva]UJO11550.1 hypothetical protein CLAFUR5_00709 [Fulvia fulva]WPV08684.1 hypothetical protein CLAFUW4_00706 [Fulvia fulva]WPV25194.1 hypothetical protein CLAFUW7_00711 [Fulvia fulva]